MGAAGTPPRRRAPARLIPVVASGATGAPAGIFPLDHRPRPGAMSPRRRPNVGVARRPHRPRSRPSRPGGPPVTAGPGADRHRHYRHHGAFHVDRRDGRLGLRRAPPGRPPGTPGPTRHRRSVGSRAICPRAPASSQGLSMSAIPTSPPPLSPVPMRPTTSCMPWPPVTASRTRPGLGPIVRPGRPASRRGPDRLPGRHGRRRAVGTPLQPPRGRTNPA